MTACDEKCVDDPKPCSEVGATEENIKADADAESKPEGECAGTCEKDAAEDPEELARQAREDAAE